MHECGCTIGKKHGDLKNLHVRIADTFLTRLRGLMGTRRLPPGEGLLLVPCNAIHMLFMRYAIDALFLDGRGRILKVATLHPWRGLSACLAAYAVLELPAGEAGRLGIAAGDTILFDGKEGDRCRF